MVTSNGFFITKRGIFTTCLGPKGLTLCITHMQNYLGVTHGYGWFVYKLGLIVAINRLIFKRIWGV